MGVLGFGDFWCSGVSGVLVSGGSSRLEEIGIFSGISGSKLPRNFVDSSIAAWVFRVGRLCRGIVMVFWDFCFAGESCFV